MYDLRSVLTPPLFAVQRVSKLPYVPEDADEFERAWLALADIHVAGGKFDLAQVTGRLPFPAI